MIPRLYNVLPANNPWCPEYEADHPREEHRQFSMEDLSFIAVFNWKRDRQVAVDADDQQIHHLAQSSIYIFLSQ